MYKFVCICHVCRALQVDEEIAFSALNQTHILLQKSQLGLLTLKQHYWYVYVRVFICGICYQELIIERTHSSEPCIANFRHIFLLSYYI